MPINIGKPNKDFPSYKDIALANLAEDTSDEKISELLNCIGECELEELEYVFYNLKITNKEKAKDLSFKILSSGRFQNMWYICIDFLSKYRITEVEDLFIYILIEYDEYNCIGHAKLKKIIDDYFKEYK